MTMGWDRVGRDIIRTLGQQISRARNHTHRAGSRPVSATLNGSAAICSSRLGGVRIAIVRRACLHIRVRQASRDAIGNLYRHHGSRGFCTDQDDPFAVFDPRGDLAAANEFRHHSTFDGPVFGRSGSLDTGFAQTFGIEFCRDRRIGLDGHFRHDDGCTLGGIFKPAEIGGQDQTREEAQAPHLNRRERPALVQVPTGRSTSINSSKLRIRVTIRIGAFLVAFYSTRSSSRRTIRQAIGFSFVFVTRLSSSSS